MTTTPAAFSPLPLQGAAPLDRRSWIHRARSIALR
jgi:hypothetical protein